MGEFYQYRMDALGVTPEKNVLIGAKVPNIDSPGFQLADISLFKEDNDGNIIINYYTLDGQIIQYMTNEKYPKPRYYTLKRLKEPKGDMKYQLPAGAGTYPWFAPALVEKYRSKTPIETLFLTEGVFKAWKGCDVGLDVVGLSSITHHSDNTGHIHLDIQRLIEDCQVRNVVVLWDGDCLNISPKSIPVREELTKRPFGFFNAAKTIRERLQRMPHAPNVYFMHIIPEAYPEKPKGLDDILIVAERAGEADKVREDAHNLDRRGKFFYKLDMTSTTDLLYHYFAIGKDDVNAFYSRHSNLIGEQHFYFSGDLYYYNNKKNEVEMIAPGWAQNLRWIGDEYFLEMVEPSARGDRRVLRKYTKETLKDLFGKTFTKFLKHFAGFCNVPNNLNYEQVIERNGRQFYNRYYPLQHVPEKGKYDKIVDFVKHIFGDTEIVHSTSGKRYVSWELGLDYLQLLYQNPTQALPVICLYSKENATGKSKFGELLQAIFGDNHVQIGNSDLQSDFNEHYVDKLVVVCEETLLERKRDVERIKALSTSSSITVNPKGQKQYTIDIFLKFIFMSNNLRMIYVTQQDERFWILNVPKPKKDNPNLMDELREQIPAFLNFLNNRKLKTEREGRMHFHYSLIRTQTFEQVVEVNEPTDATDLRERVRDLFLSQPPGDMPTEICMTLKEIKTEFFGGKVSDKWIQEILHDYLHVDLKRKESGEPEFIRGSYKKYYYEATTDQWTTKEIKWRGRPYVFLRSEFLLPDEIIEEQDTDDDWIPADANPNGVHPTAVPATQYDDPPWFND